MPELPEVETTRRGVAPALTGRCVVAVRVYDRRLRWPVPAGLEIELAGRELVAVDRRSKYLLFRWAPRGKAAVTSPPRRHRKVAASARHAALPAPAHSDTLLVHLGMTGSLRVLGRATERAPHDHVDIVFDDGSTLRFRDPRRFGTILWIPGDAATHPLLASLGAEPFTPDFNADAFHRATRGRRVAIKLALMDNRIVVGVGNIYASEALFRAGIRPTRAAGRLSRERLAALVDAVRATLAAAIAKGGSTLRDYVGSDGVPGEFQLRTFVYGREGEPCRVCGTPIKAVRQGQRSTFYCPTCQV